MTSLSFGLLSHCWPDNFGLCNPVGRPEKKIEAKEIYVNQGARLGGVWSLSPLGKKIVPILSQLLPKAASDHFKSFIGHLKNTRNDTVQIMKILQTFWALAQNKNARLVSAEQCQQFRCIIRGNAWQTTDALVNCLCGNGLFEFNIPPALWVDYQGMYNNLATHKLPTRNSSRTVAVWRVDLQGHHN
ncbi:hypothetical protein PROFUN_02469 [Planoprotostelium fungivorum]|uniref:Uncharacterized protein n=1 Tax=Planoprotostelium fungivorum TaxID=1890364 RepID=A0A2P6MP26_9EUKA|nr:hypothetical protein PROFUN_02469 [Planoprotostelium fungivorum]